jgi:hypothetical protein
MVGLTIIAGVGCAQPDNVLGQYGFPAAALLQDTPKSHRTIPARGNVEEVLKEKAINQP